MTYTTRLLKWIQKGVWWSNNLDAGSTKPKSRIPIWKLRLENEEEIPQKPEVILDKPNDKHYEKQLEEIEKTIAFHKNSIVSLF